MADQIQMIHKAVIQLKTVMKTLLKKGVAFDLSDTEEDLAAMELDMMKQLLGGAGNTTDSAEKLAAMEFNVMKQLLAGPGNTTGQSNSYSGMPLQIVGESGDTTGDNMFSQLFGNAMGGNQATDSRKNDEDNGNPLLTAGQTSGDDAQQRGPFTEATSDFGSIFGGGFKSLKASSPFFFK
ncbi:uncharacterized protein LOC124271327 isoform X2 [Haliotis rubra]|nr:uncharacterized protein LOC124271327 isoform X2 [Haliotis rubra]